MTDELNQSMADAWADEELAKRARAGGLQAPNVSSDDMAAAVSIGKKRDLPPLVVADDLPNYRDQEHLDALAAAAKANPGFGLWVEKPENAALAKGDLPALQKVGQSGFYKAPEPSYVEELIGQARGAYTRADNYVKTFVFDPIFGNKIDPTVAKNLGYSSAEDYGTGESSALYASKNREAQRVEVLSEKTAAQQQEIADASGWWDSTKAIVSNPRALGVTLTTSMAQFAPVLAASTAASVTGGPYAGAITAGSGSFALEYGNTMAADLQAAGVDDTDSLAVRRYLSDPAALAKSREHATARGIPVAVFDALTQGLAGKLLVGSTGTVASTVTRSAGEIALQGTGGALGELSAEVNSGETINPSSVLQEFFAEIPTGLVEVPSNVAHVKRALQAENDRVLNVSKHLYDQDYLKNIIAASQETKLFKQSPEKFEEMLTSQVGDTKVFVPAEDLAALFQSERSDPAARIEELTGDANAWAEASASGGAVAIPLAKYITAFGDQHDNVGKNARVNPDLVFEESAAKDLQIPTREQVQDEIRKIMAEGQKEDVRDNGPSGQVYDEFYGQLLGRTDEKSARQQAAVMQSLYRNLGDRVGVDAYTLSQRFRINIGSPKMPAAGRQRGVDTHIDPLIESAMTGKNFSDKDIYGGSLIPEIVALGGINPESVGGGDLRGQDAAMRPGLLSMTGMTVERMAQTLADRGFNAFTTKDEAGRPDYRELLNLISDELGGNKVYSKIADDNQDQTRITRREAFRRDADLVKANFDKWERDNKRSIADLTPEERRAVALQSFGENTNADGPALEQSAPGTSKPTESELQFANGQEIVTTRLEQWASSVQLGDGIPRPVLANAENIGAITRGPDTGAVEQGDASPGTIREESQRLIDRAKSEGYFWGADSPILAEIAKLQNAGGAEHQVFIAGEGENRVIIRGTDNGYFGPRSDISPAQYLARLDDYSATFPAMQTRLIGVSESPDVEGNAVIWSAQPFVFGQKFKSQALLEEAMLSRGWEVDGAPGDPRFLHKETGTIIEDAHTDNVFYDENGDLYPFDVVVESLPAKIDQTQTPEFKAWFGDSKVVDADGNPLVVYHGAKNSGFNKFDTSNPGAFFTDNWSLAADYGSPDEVEFSSDGEKKAGVGAVYDVYLKAENPKIVDFNGAQNNHGPGGKSIDDLAYLAKKQGFDSFIAENVKDFPDSYAGDGDTSTVYVIFSPEQIKSATGNSGAFDANDPNILFQSENAAPVFYSQLINTIETGKPTKSSGEQWLGFLKNQPGIKQEELDYYDLPAWLDGQKSVTKEQLLEYLRANELAVEEKVLGGKPITDPSQWRFQVRDVDPVYGVANFGVYDNISQQFIGRFDNRDDADRYSYILSSAEIANNGGSLPILPDNLKVRRIVEQDVDDFGLDDDDIGTYAVFDDQDEHLGSLASTNYAEAVVEAVNMAGNPDGEAMMDGTPVTVAAPYSNMVMPGGENYRVLLMKMPKQQGVAPLIRLNWEQSTEDMLTAELPNGRFVTVTYDSQNPQYGAALNTTDENGETLFPDVEFPSLEAAQNAALSLVEKREKNLDGFTSNHFTDGHNVVAHVRFDERTDSDGKKVLFVQEIQSDWHQAGRKEGYRGVDKKVDTTGWTAIRTPGGYANDWQVFDASGELVGNRKGENEADAILAATKPLFPGNQVPDAPFKTTWPELVIKRMLRYAVDNGFDRLAFPNEDMVPQIEQWGRTLQEIKANENYSKRFGAILERYSTEIPRIMKAQAKKLGGGIVKSDVGFKKGEDGELVGPPVLAPMSQLDRGVLPDAPDFPDGSAPLVGKTTVSVNSFNYPADVVVHGDGIHIFANDENGTAYDFYRQWRPADWHSISLAPDAAKGANGLAQYYLGGPGGLWDQFSDDPDIRIRSGKVEAVPDLLTAIEITPAMRDKVSAGLPLFQQNVGTQSTSTDKLRTSARSMSSSSFMATFGAEVLPEHLDSGLMPPRWVHDIAEPSSLDPFELDDWSEYQGSDKVREMQEAAASGELPAVLVRGALDDKSLRPMVVDGHHRTTAAINAGAQIPIFYDNETLAEIWIAENKSDKTKKAILSAHVEAIKTSSLQQRKGAKGPRGQITGRDGKSIIRQKPDRAGVREFNIQLLDGADTSTFLHETAHAFLEIMADLAGDKDAPQQIRDDWAKAMAWLGVSDRSQIGRDQHEKWARGFELYYREGKSPSAALRRAFASFKVWLTNIYKTALSLDVNLTDDVRGVFDRILASDAEIAEAQTLVYHEALLSDALAVGMSEAEYDAYERAVADTKAEAEAVVAAQVLEAEKRAQLSWWRSERKLVRLQVEAELRALPVYRAIRWLRQGLMPDGSPAPKIKLSKEALLDEKGPAFLKRFTGLYSATGGITPNEAASLMGYSSGGELLDAIVNAPKLQEVIESDTARIMAERYPDPLTDGSLPDRAMAAVHSDKQADVMLREIKALERHTGEKRATTGEVIREVARRILSEKRGRDIIPNLYRQAEAKAGREAFEAAASGDWATALAARRRQLLNLRLFQEAQRVRAEVESIGKYLKGYTKTSRRAKLGKAGFDYLEQIDGILERFDFRQVSGPASDRRARLKDWIQSKLDQQIDVDLPAKLLDDAFRMPFKDLNIADLRMIRDSVKHLAHLADTKNTLLLNGERRDREAIDAAMSGSVLDNNKLIADVPGEPSKGAEWAKAASWERATMGAATDMARRLDGYTNLGPVWMNTVGVIRDAINNRVNPALQKAQEAVANLYRSKYTTKELRAFSNQYAVDGVPGIWTKARILSLALNWGNEGNRTAVLSQNKQRLTAVEVGTLLGTLDARDWAFVQETWAYVDSFWPEIAESQRRRKGLVPEKVEASPFTVITSGGDTINLKGGYYPLKYEPDTARKLREQTDEFFESIRTGKFGKASTKDGHTEERVGSGGATVQLELEVLDGHLRNVIRDIHLGDAVNYVHNVMKGPGFLDAAGNTGNLEIIRGMDLWLRDVATGDLGLTDQAQRIARAFRTNFVASVLTFKAVNAFMQLTGVLQTSVVLGKGYTLQGVARYLRYNPKTMTNYVTGASPFMASRANSHIEAVQDLINARAGRYEAAKSAMIRTGYRPIGFFQQIVDTMTWLGAEAKGMADFEGDVKKARAYADDIVTRSQGSGEFMDKIALQRGTAGENQRQAEWIKAFTALQGYMITKHNASIERTLTAKKGIDGINMKSMQVGMNWAFDMVNLFLTEAVLVAVMKGVLPEDDDDKDGDGITDEWLKFLGMEGMANLLGGLPGLGSLVTQARGFDSTGVVQGMWKSVVDSFEQNAQIIEGDEDTGDFDKAWVKAHTRMLGYFTGIPASQINKTVDAIAAKQDGEDVSVLDYLRGPKPDK